MDPALGGGRGETEAVDQRGLEPGAYDLPHQCGGRVVAAAGAPLGGIHHALEHAAQHVGGDHVALLRFARRRSESTRLNSSHMSISYAVFCLKKKKKTEI